ncbi:opioid growth factor receptor-related protein [Vibrio chaetopteri]|uniref:opioid growth factor receptor-related protein n=1 Tax=Vibrio chaetopteri TaxID=3016528 RepID=UPI003AB6FEC1
MKTEQSVLIAFQLGKGTDHQGRFISEIWDFNSFWLEHDHKYIQWLFPIDAQTKFNRHAPVLTTDDRAAFFESEVLQQAQRKSLDLLLHFFGLQWQEGEIFPSAQLNIREHIWLKRGGHNHLRISRIIRSLALCGQHKLSYQFQQAVIKVAKEYGEVSEESMGYWFKAATDLDSNTE